MIGARSTLVCAGCGHLVGYDEMLPFSCPDAGLADDIDHVLQRRLELTGSQVAQQARKLFEASEPNPFLKYRTLLHAYITARAGGLSDDDYVEIVEETDRQVAAVAGSGFRVTPQVSAPDLAAALGVAEVMIKDETGNVSGTHKGRHLIGTLLWLRLAERIDPGDRRAAQAPLAVASCGNAALAAGMLASATGRRLGAFIPDHADPLIVAHLQRLGVELTTCARRPGEPGDPSYLAFRNAARQAQLPFSCQGPDNALALDGGRTIAWEMVSAAAEGGRTPSDLFIQVGGGALASSCIQGLREARDLGVLGRMPRILTVQAEAASPLERAYELAIETILERFEVRSGQAPPRMGRAERARFVSDSVPPSIRQEVLQFAATHRGAFMRPWPTEPRSVADAILDDETYDWLEVIRGLIDTAGFPVLVSDDTLRQAHALARQTTTIPVSINGASGLAGCLQLGREGLLDGDHSVALLFTGVERQKAGLS